MPWVARTLKRAAGRVVWHDRDRKIQMLLAFGRTEAGGAVDIARAAEASHSTDLRDHLERHCADESRHAEMFRVRARQVFHEEDEGEDPPWSPGIDFVSLAADQSPVALSLTDHGFIPSDHFDELGDIRYIAMLHLAEKQAAEDFAVHYRSTKDHDPKTAAVFREILRDEEYHVAYTRAQLQKWADDGQDKEVRKALRRMRWNRFKTAWVQVAQLLGDFLGTVMMTVTYFTLFLPFGLIGRLTRRRPNWQAMKRSLGHDAEELQCP